jgi:hypothetical protein
VEAQSCFFQHVSEVVYTCKRCKSLLFVIHIFERVQPLTLQVGTRIINVYIKPMIR